MSTTIAATANTNGTAQVIDAAQLATLLASMGLKLDASVQAAPAPVAAPVAAPAAPKTLAHIPTAEEKAAFPAEVVANVDAIVRLRAELVKVKNDCAVVIAGLPEGWKDALATPATEMYLNRADVSEALRSFASTRIADHDTRVATSSAFRENLSNLMDFVLDLTFPYKDEPADSPRKLAVKYLSLYKNVEGKNITCQTMLRNCSEINRVCSDYLLASNRAVQHNAWYNKNKAAGKLPVPGTKPAAKTATPVVEDDTDFLAAA